jgi:hypothetical protein
MAGKTVLDYWLRRQLWTRKTALDREDDPWAGKTETLESLDWEGELWAGKTILGLGRRVLKQTIITLPPS